MAFTTDRHTLSSRDLAAMTGIPLPSVYRYVAFLRDSGLLIGDDRGGYHLSARVIALARAAQAAESLIGVADPVMRRLSSETGETVLLVRLIARSAVCIHRIESAHRLRISFEPGQPLGLDRGASARLLLASMSPRERREQISSLARRDQAAARRLEREVELTARRGWATSEEELDEGVWAPAAAVENRSGLVAVLSMPTPLVRAPVNAREELLRRVRAAADEIGRLLQAEPEV